MEWGEKVLVNSREIDSHPTGIIIVTEVPLNAPTDCDLRVCPMRYEII